MRFLFAVVKIVIDFVAIEVILGLYKYNDY